MRFAAEKNNLLEALSKCIAVADPKATNRLLASVLLDTRGSLSASATDLYRSMTARISGEQTNKGGAICLPGRELHERVKLMPDGMVTLLTEAHKATITGASRRKFTMQGFPADEFPTIPAPTVGERFKTTTHSLAELIASVQHAVCPDSSRIHMNGVLLEVDANGQRAVATDGHRVATVLHGSEPSGSRWLIPQLAIPDLRRLCTTSADEDVTLTQNGGTLFAEFAGYTFSTRLLDPKFVPWLSVFPTGNDRVVRVPREAFANAVRAISVSTKENGAIRLTFKKCALVLQASAGTGDGFDEIEIDYEGDEFTIAVSFRILLDALNVVATETVTIATGGQRDPLVIRIPGHDDAFAALLMPVDPNHA